LRGARATGSECAELFELSLGLSLDPLPRLWQGLWQGLWQRQVLDLFDFLVA
jgi:hypothetical protein